VTAPDAATAVSNARQYRTYPPGYCLRFVRQEAWKIGGLYASAIDAWWGAVKRHPGDRNPPLGAPMFYEGGRYGHIVINTGQGVMRSTDCRTSGNVSEADQDWPVQNWGQRYLGWSEDLNGVDLPLKLEEEEDEMKPEDWIKLRSIVAEEVAANNPDLVDKVWHEQIEVTKPNGDKDQKSARGVIRETWQKVSKGL
jgi:hypothetical protein